MTKIGKKEKIRTEAITIRRSYPDLYRKVKDSPSERKELFSKVCDEENIYRELFAQERDSQELHDPFALLVDAHENEDIFR